MYVPFVSATRPEREKRAISNRVGGGGGGRGGGGFGGGGRTGGTSSGGGTASSPAGRTVSSGGGAVRSVPAGQPFAGRSFGGQPRSAIYGSRGGAYPLGVAGLGFGFGYWPLYWGAGYRGNDEYGPSNNGSRPGGPQIAAAFSFAELPNAEFAPPQYSLYGDNSTVYDVAEDLMAACNATFTGDSTMSNVNRTLVPQPEPDYAIQYYREASFVLLSYISNGTTPPSTAIVADQPFVYPQTARNDLFESCINSTIGSNIPIADAAFALQVPALALLAVTGLTMGLLSA